MKSEGILEGTLSAEGALVGVITPADTENFLENYATDDECVAVIDDSFKQLDKGE